MTRGWLTSVFCALLLLMSGAPASASAAAENPSASLKVMTRNLYLGADLRPVFAAGSPQALVAAVTTAFAGVRATNFPERAQALADEIAGADPHLVGLQEAVLWRSQTPAQPGSATHVEYDFLQILLDELALRGKHYAAVATVTLGDYEAPQSTPGGLQDIRLTDRDVLLARTDLSAKVFRVGHPEAQQFTARVTLNNPVLGPIVIPQGWVAADATVRGRTTRVVSTHLEPLSSAVQQAQAAELLAGPLDTTLPTVLLGDLNSAAGGVGAVPGRTDTPTYGQLLAAGFTDAWTARHHKDPGFTCCQAADLRNATSMLSQRIDYVLFRNGFKALSSHRTGAEPDDRTPSGLWPSDHAGLWSRLHIH